MAWIEFHTAKIKKLKKFSDLRRTLQWNINETLGFLGSFWGEAIEIRECGDISDWTPDYLCELTNVSLDPKRVWDALVDHRWIDVKESGLMLIHDWLDTAGTYLRNRYARDNRQRLVEIWALHGKSYGSPDSQPIPNRNPTLPNLTKPYLTKPERETFPVSSLNDKEEPPLPNGENRKRSRRKEPRRAEDKVMYFQEMVDHITTTWEKKKNAKMSWDGKNFALLKSKAKIYMAWGIMALWDIYLRTVDDWYRRHGYDVPTFVGAISFLVDDPNWKVASKSYESKLIQPRTQEERDNQAAIGTVLASAMAGKVNGVIQKNRKELDRVGIPL